MKISREALIRKKSGKKISFLRNKLQMGWGEEDCKLPEFNTS